MKTRTPKPILKSQSLAVRIGGDALSAVRAEMVATGCTPRQAAERLICIPPLQLKACKILAESGNLAGKPGKPGRKPGKPGRPAKGGAQ